MEYRWIEKDPAIDIVRQALELSHMDIYQVSAETYKHGHGVSVHTIQEWLYGKTRRPYRSTIEAVLTALGVEIEYIHAVTGQKLKQPEAFNGLREGTMIERKQPTRVEIHV